MNINVRHILWRIVHDKMDDRDERWREFCTQFPSKRRFLRRLLKKVSSGYVEKMSIGYLARRLEAIEDRLELIAEILLEKRRNRNE